MIFVVVCSVVKKHASAFAEAFLFLLKISEILKKFLKILLFKQENAIQARIGEIRGYIFRKINYQNNVIR